MTTRTLPLVKEYKSYRYKISVFSKRMMITEIYNPFGDFKDGRETFDEEKSC